MKKYPDKIYLQRTSNDEDDDHNGVTWCIDRINDADVEYIRADLVSDLNKKIIELKGGGDEQNNR